MHGIEYILLHVQEPILYVIRKQHRHSPSQVTPLADYYILAGYVYQAPDLSSVINARLQAGVHHLQSAFEEVHSFMRYNPTKGYSWDFGNKDVENKEKQADKSNKDKAKEEPSSMFQRRRVDVLIQELMKKFPPKVPTGAQSHLEQTKQEPNPSEPDTKTIIDKSEIKTEKIEPVANNAINTTMSMNRASSGQPPEKKPRLNL